MVLANAATLGASLAAASGMGTPVRFFNGWLGFLRTSVGTRRTGKADHARRNPVTSSISFEPLEDRRLLAIRALGGFDDFSLPAGDEVSSAQVNLGFNAGFFGNTFGEVFVNNNGSVSFDAALPNWSASALADLPSPIIAPFYSDVDTTGGAGVVNYGFDMIGGRSAFAATWNGVGGADADPALRNSYQLVIIDRSDIAAGDFDLEFNYDNIDWDISRDTILPFFDVFSRPGFASLNGPGRNYELIASGLEGLLLDSNATFGLVTKSLRSAEPGRYIFQFRGGSSLDYLGLAGQSIVVAPGFAVLGRGIDPDDLPALPTNANAADTTNTNRLQSGGDLANLTGAGLTVGLFEANQAGPDSSYPRTTHQELVGRVTIVDSATPVFSDHATHVAGTIAAAGVNASARGMATAINLSAYNEANDLMDLAVDAAVLDLSNHSYAAARGWQILDLGLGADVSVWLADRTVFATEDPAFGKYGADARALDDLLFANAQVAANDFLSVWSAGDDRDDQFAAAPGITGYVAPFSVPPAGGFPLGFNYWLVPTTGATLAPPGDGNSGTGFDSLPDEQVAKNTLVVGSIRDVTVDPFPALGTTDLSAFSSYGATDDGRIKPDLVANGQELTSSIATNDTAYGTQSGTSSAAANATGSAALVLQHYQNQQGVTPRSATLKGTLIHTAHDIGNKGPDYSSGWGLLDAAAAAQFITKATTPVVGETSLISENLYLGVTQNIPVAANENGTLKVTIVWTDPAGAANPNPNTVDDTTKSLINDLDLRIIDPNGNVFFPWSLNPANPGAGAVRTVRNEVDNVEQVVIDSPIAGNYMIRISHTGVINGANQPYSLLVNAAPAIVDTQGPQVTSLGITGQPLFNIFETKPGSPTPPVSSLSIGIRDLPVRQSGFVDPAINGGDVSEVEPNDTVGTAQPIDRDFNLTADGNIGDTTNNTSATIPHTTILGAGDDTYDYYSFTIDSPGVTGIFDIDATSPGFDSTLFLFDSAGNPLAPNPTFTNDDSSTAFGAGGSTSGLDSYFEYTFVAAGTYVVGVARFNATAAAGGILGPPVPAGASYTLQISIPQHVVTLHEGFFTIKGDAGGIIPIQQVIFDPDPVVPGQPASGTLRVVFFEPLPDDRYTLTISDSLTDPSGNKLDGESNAIQPGTPTFPSGNGAPGGDFVARFSIDSAPEIAVYSGTTITADINGNGFFDPQNADATNRDLMFQFGGISDHRFAGKLGTSGFDVFALYGRAASQFRFVFDTNGNGSLDVADTTTVAGLQVNGLAAAGNFNIAAAGDEVAVFDGTRWFLDTNGNRNIDAGDTQVPTAMRGYPVVGDFDGDGDDDLGTYQNDTWFFDLDRNGTLDATIAFGALGKLDRPVVADLDGDGIDDLGLWVPDSGTLGGDGEWRWLISNDPTAVVRIPNTVTTLNHPFAPFPLGADRTFKFGSPFALPLVGNFDPPVGTTSSAVTTAPLPPPTAALIPPKTKPTTPAIVLPTPTPIAASQKVETPPVVTATPPAAPLPAAPAIVTTTTPSVAAPVSVVTTADVSVVKVAAAMHAIAGANVVYTITVRNASRAEAQNVVVTDFLPNGLTILSHRQTSGPAFELSNTGMAVRNTLSAMPAVSYATFEIVARVAADLPDKFRLINGATITTSSIDPRPRNNAIAAPKVSVLHAGIALADTWAGLSETGNRDSESRGHVTATWAGLSETGNRDSESRGHVTDLIIGGSVRGDVLAVMPGANGQVQVWMGGRHKGTFSPTGKIIVHGRAGNDTITVDPRVKATTLLFGEAGDDTLIAGGGNAVLVGGDGADTLTSGAGRNLLIAGQGASDKLDGTLGSNVLVRGSTNYDAHEVALAELLAEWSRNDADDETRLSHLRDTFARGLNDPYKLDPATVLNYAGLEPLLIGDNENWL